LFGGYTVLTGMSYDLYLFRPSRDGDPALEAHELLDQDSEEVNPGLPDSSKEALKARLASALTRSNPALKVFEFGFAEIAEQLGITVDEARVRFRHLELNGAEDGYGIQITLFDDVATVTVPYWHAGAAADRVFGEIWKYLAILESEGELEAFDPQLERLLDLNGDFDAVTECYRGVADRMGEIVGKQRRHRRWWKFW
jgi:hypothetical protein